MNIFDIEKSRLELKKILKENKSSRAKALFISFFFKEVLNTRTKKDEFTVIPSYESLEERLKAQIITSWELAKSKCARFIKKFYKAYEIIIRFDKKYGYYIGES